LIFKCLPANDLQKGDVILCPHLKQPMNAAFCFQPVIRLSAFFVGSTGDK